MKFLVIYQEMGLQSLLVEKEQQQVIEQLGPAFSRGLIEDVIFLSTYKKGRPHEIIDLSEQPMEVTPIKAEISTIGLDLKDLMLKKST